MEGRRENRDGSEMMWKKERERERERYRESVGDNVVQAERGRGEKTEEKRGRESCQNNGMQKWMRRLTGKVDVTDSNRKNRGEAEKLGGDEHNADVLLNSVYCNSSG